MDIRYEQMLSEYKANKPTLEKINEIVLSELRRVIKEQGSFVAGVEGRVKTEQSLRGKLELKGLKYNRLSDITDLVGARVVTFYQAEVDKIAAIVENLFEIDWENSVDKRKLYAIDQFGYLSLHYICRIPKTLYCDPDFPAVNEIRFEIQMRTALQHVWATVNHDTGYKSAVDVPVEYSRRLSRLAGLLEMADEEFNNIRCEIENYKRRVTALVAGGKFDEVSLNIDSFEDYMKLDPFRKLIDAIAAVNNAQVVEVSAKPYLEVFQKLGFRTLGDIERFREDCYDPAFHLASYQIGVTDIDIIASTIGVQNLVIVYILKNGGGVRELTANYLDILYGKRDRNVSQAERLIKQAGQLNIIR